MKSEKTCLDLFKFRVLQDIEDQDITYKLLLGKEELLSYITICSNNFATTSAALEKLLFDKQAEIELDYDTEPTVLTFRNDKDFVSVHVEPSHFHHMDSFSGICNQKELIRELYDGLLFGTTFCYDDIGSGWNWHYCKMVCYNMMKSRTIEEYLRTSCIKKIENYVAKHVLIYDGTDILHVCDETLGYRIPISDTMNIKDKAGNSIAEINGQLLRNGEFDLLVQALPEDCDFWVITKDEDDYVRPTLIKREVKGSCPVFIKENLKVEELGADPYGFTSETLWHACSDLDFDRIKHYLSIGADMTFFFRWIIASNKGGTTDSAGNPTYDESLDSLMARDKVKAAILEYVFDNYPNVSPTEDMLKTCMWHYSPLCMKILLEHGANPTEKKYISYWRSIKVKYRSVLNLVNLQIEEGKDKFGIYLEMKKMLEAANAEDIVIWNDEYK